jgi:heme exporter protein C
MAKSSAGFRFKDYWWKILSGVLLLYAIVAGFLTDIPLQPVAEESMRNLFFHVGMWFVMFAMLITGFVFSLQYLKNFRIEKDIVAVEAINVGLVFGLLGIITGMVWANFTWGSPWVKDPKLNGAAVGIFIYLAYMVLRRSIGDTQKRAKVSAVYNILAFVLWIVFVIILPRLTGQSIHPGTGGNEVPVLPMYLDPGMRIVFYPAMAGWILLGFWILQVRIRIRKIQLIIENK